MSLPIGTTLLSRYKIIDELGSGGFGDTYLAIDIALPGHPRCVVKHLLPKDPNPAVFPIAKRLFDREAEFLYRLGRHDQIPALNAHFCEDGEFYLVQEFVEGDELSKEITPGKKLSEDQTVELLKEILKVLAVVHQQNVIHRDIKLSNIMRRSRDGKLVLIDFGAVKEISGLAVNSRGQTSVTIVVGTPGYMPSEQTQGRPRLSSDIYAVGMVGIQALTGVSPKQLPEDRQTGEIIWRDRVQVSDKLAKFFEKMVRHDFSLRYATATEALQDLEQLSNISDETPTVLMPSQPSGKEQPSPVSSDFYIERPPIEEICLAEIEQEGALLRIKAPQKMGKTLLLRKIFESVGSKNYGRVRIDLQLLESSILGDYSQFLRWLCQRVSKRLKLEDCLEDYWGEMTPNTSCTDYFEEYILESLETPLLLGIDNIDRIFAPEFGAIAADFFGLLRSWWGEANTTGGNWTKLRLIVIYSTEDLPKLNSYQSPFNVGTEIKLPEFEDEQVQKLALRYGVNWSLTQVQQLKEQIGGHPYLVHEAIKNLKMNPELTLTHLLEKAATDEGIYAQHLQHHWSTLEKEPTLVRQLKIIVEASEPIAIAPTYLYKLDSMGLITKVGNQVKPRCQVYRQYFRERLLTVNDS